MSKEEIALELAKLSYKNAVDQAAIDGIYDIGKVVADLYNYIFTNITVSEPNK